MIKEGKQGSVNFFWNDLFIASQPLGYKQYNDYIDASNELIIDGMTDYKTNLKKQIDAYKVFCNCVYQRKLTGKRLNTENMNLFCASCLALVKLKYVEEEDVILIMPKKKPKKISTNNNGYCRRL